MKRNVRKMNIDALARFVSDNEKVSDYQFSRFICLL